MESFEEFKLKCIIVSDISSSLLDYINYLLIHPEKDLAWRKEKVTMIQPLRELLSKFSYRSIEISQISILEINEIIMEYNRIKNNMI